jgi:hypothetical protein
VFKRLAPQIDGLWLVPDDRILSPAVLRELLNYAVSHGVRVCVFSDTLLQWGADECERDARTGARCVVFLNA